MRLSYVGLKSISVVPNREMLIASGICERATYPNLRLIYEDCRKVFK